MVPVVGRLLNRYTTVHGILKELKSIGCKIKAQTLLILLRIYWHGGLHELVFETYELMESLGFIPNTFARNVLIDVHFKAGRADAALEVLKQTPVPNFLSFNITLCHLSKLDDVVNIKNILRDMLRSGFYPNVSTLEMILNVFCNRSRLAEAAQVMALIISLGVTPSVNAWSMLIHGFCLLRRFDVAVYLLGKMSETGCPPNVVTYTSLIKAFMDSHMVDDALRILSTMLTKGNAPDLVLYNVLIHCFGKIGRYDDAIKTFASLSAQKLSPDSYTLSSLVTTLRSSKKLFLLDDLVRGLVLEADQVVCNSLLSYFCKVGLLSLAVDLYIEMADRGFKPDNYSFAEVLSGLCKSRRIDKALNLYDDIASKNADLDPHVHTVVMDGLIKDGRCHHAIKLFEKVVRDKVELDVRSYTVAIRGLFKAGKGHDVIALYERMKEGGLLPDASTYNVMVSGFCRNKDAKMVTKIVQEMVNSRIQLSHENFTRISNFLSRPC